MVIFIPYKNLIEEISYEDELLLLCARNYLEKDSYKRFVSLMLKELDWEYLIQRASIHGLTAFLYFHINSISSENVPEDILKHLKNKFNAIFQKNLFLTNELLNIVEYMDSNNIKIMPYKGPFLALLANQNLSFRQFGDLDILVSKKDVKKVSELLISNGYETKIPFSPENEDFYIKHLRDIQFINKKSGIYVEIHWTPIHRSFSFPSDPSFLWKKQTIKTNIEGFEILSPPIEELVIILSLHCAGHCWDRLSWLIDITELLRNNDVNWNRLLGMVRKLNVERILLINLLLTNKLLDLRMPKAILKIINDDKAVTGLSGQILRNFLSNNYPYGILGESFFHLKIREKKWDGFKDSMNLIFKPTEEELEIYKPNKYLNPFIFLLRPLNALSKKTNILLKK